MKAISIKIFEDFTTNEFLRENILDFQFVTSNRTKDELIWKIVRNGTVLNRFIPFYVKDLFKEEVVFICNELQIKTEGQIIDDLKRQLNEAESRIKRLLIRCEQFAEDNNKTEE